MYIIIGGDGKEYGPITQEDVRQWIAEGRLNAQSLAKSVSDAEFRPLDKFPEFADVWGGGGTPGTIAPPSSTVSDADYELVLGGCISSGYELVKRNMNVLVVGVLAYLAIEFGVGMVSRIPLIGGLFSLANFVASGPLMGGVLYLFIRAIRGEPVQVGDIFLGFRRAFGQLFLATLVQALLIGVCLLPALIVLAMKLMPLSGQLQSLQTGTPPSPELIAALKSAILSGLPLALICIVPATYLAVSWKFTLPLIIDKQMGFWQAMMTSWKMVNKHWWLVFGLTILISLINLAGIFACCIGLLFTIPLGFAALMFAYETIFNAKKD